MRKRKSGGQNTEVRQLTHTISRVYAPPLKS